MPLQARSSNIHSTTMSTEEDDQIESEAGDPEASTSSSLLRETTPNPSNSQLTLASIQQVANLVAHSLALLSLLVVSRWVSQLGGLSWKEGESKQVFNWHPLLMIVAFNFMTVATLSFRFPFRSLVRSLSMSKGTAQLLVVYTKSDSENWLSFSRFNLPLQNLNRCSSQITKPN